jgi:hypothetical protein
MLCRRKSTRQSVALRSGSRYDVGGGSVSDGERREDDSRTLGIIGGSTQNQSSERQWRTTPT